MLGFDAAFQEWRQSRRESLLQGQQDIPTALQDPTRRNPEPARWPHSPSNGRGP